ncbi:MAG: methyltransferase [Campylobacterota bacterium]|nr:methyltransferase [Campylobacterota bacterium]
MILYQPIDGYCYNSDTHFLYNFFIKSQEKYKNIKGDILDIGSGSGVLGLLIARDYTKLNLHQCEIQTVFQFLSQKNSEINGIKNIIYKDDILNCQFDKKFDFIVSNPPFYNSDVIKSENQNKKIARYNDNMPLDNFISKVAKILNTNGKFIFCYDAKQLNNILLALNKAKLTIEMMQFLHPKPTKEASLVMIYARSNSKSKLQVIEPLIMFDKFGDFTQEVNDIYTKCSTHSIKCQITH